jgi:hypothetical protein
MIGPQAGRTPWPPGTPPTSRMQAANHTASGSTPLRTLRWLGPLLAYAVLRTFWHWTSYAMNPDVAIQMQVALNLMKGLGVTFCMGPTGAPVCTDYFNHPPGGSLWILLFQPLTGNIILSDLVGRCVMSVIEGALVLAILRRYALGRQGQFVVMAVTALYVGHLDRGGATDMLSGILSFWVMVLVHERLRPDDARRPSPVALLSALVLLLPVIKYNAITVSLTPLALFLAAAGLGRGRLLTRREMAGLGFATAGALGLFLWMVKTKVVSHPVLAGLGYSSGGVKSTFAYQPSAWADLPRVDHFWLHFGKDVDRYVKYAVDYFHPASAGPLFLHHATQAATLACLALLLWAIRRRTPLQPPLIFTIGAFSLSQAALLALMTLTHEPEIAKYGIDGMKWVYMEEARYYSYISFAVMLALLVAAWRHLRPAFWGLTLLIGLNAAKSLPYRTSAVPRLVKTLDRLERGEPLPPFEEPRADRDAYFLRTLLLGRYDGQP